jgi:hypothetical protein
MTAGAAFCEIRYRFGKLMARIGEVLPLVAFIVAGLLLMIFRREFARWGVQSQNRFWGFNLSSFDERIFEVAAVLMGLVWVLACSIRLVQLMR